jgi:hypothetical protein
MEVAMFERIGTLSRHSISAGLVGSLVAGFMCTGNSIALAQGTTPDFSVNGTIGWTAVGTEWTALPNGPQPVKQDPAHRYVPNNVGGQPTFRVADLTNPNLTQFAKDSLKKVNEEVLAGKPMWSRSSRCWATGVPGFILTPAQPMFVVHAPKQVVMMHQHDNDVRRIHLNVSHSANVKPSWYGESVGRWDGDTLVVDTIGLNDRTFVDNFRTPHSDKLHVVERYRLIEGGRFLETQVTMEDPAIFIQPLQVTKRSRRVEARIAEWRCAAGEINYFGYDADPVPTAVKADF